MSPAVDPCDHAQTVLVFARSPDIGRVKTRLQHHLSAKAVVMVYRCMVADVLDAADKAGCPVTVCFHPADAEARMRDWLGPSYAYLAQRGKTLGERMKNAFVDTFETGAVRVVLVGTDIPTLESRHIRQAFATLHHRPAVLGPTYDGGYGLIGFTAGGFLPAVFDDGIPWGTDRVLTDTRDRLSAHRVDAVLLPPIADIDDPADLQQLMRTTAEPRIAKATRACLSRLDTEGSRGDNGGTGG